MSHALPSFLDANSVERVAIDFLCFDIKRHPKNHIRTNISHQEWLFKESYMIGLTWRASFLAKVGCMALTSTRGLPRLPLVFWGVYIFPDFLVKALAIPSPRRVCRLVLSLFGKDKWLVSKVPGWRLELGLDRRLNPFSKESNEVGLFWSFVSIKLDGLRMLEVRRPMLNFFLLVLGVLSNATPGDIHGSPWVL